MGITTRGECAPPLQRVTNCYNSRAHGHERPEKLIEQLVTYCCSFMMVYEDNMIQMILISDYVGLKES